MTRNGFPSWILVAVAANSRCSVSAFHELGWRSRPYLLAPLAAQVSVQGQGEEQTSTVSFLSPEMHVYIEDTDAYGIMYNSNYLRAFDRALHMSSSSNPEIQGTLPGQHEGWSIVSFDQQKFKSSPRLGEAYVIGGELKSSGEGWEIWDMSMTNPGGDTLFNSMSNLKIAKQPELIENLFSPRENAKFDLVNGPPGFTTHTSNTYTVYRDEIDAHWPGHLPLRNILNFFERSRSNSIGGPSNLRKMQEDEDGVVFVVTAIRSCSLIDEGVACYPGQQVTVETFLVPKRRGMILECYQTAMDGSTRIAQGRVSLMVLDAKTRKPCTNLPQSILQWL